MNVGSTTSPNLSNAIGPVTPVSFVSWSPAMTLARVFFGSDDLPFSAGFSAAMIAFAASYACGPKSVGASVNPAAL